MAKMDLNEDDEKANIETIFWSAMDMLSDDDKKLPQASSHLCISFWSQATNTMEFSTVDITVRLQFYVF